MRKTFIISSILFLLFCGKSFKLQGQNTSDLLDRSSWLKRTGQREASFEFIEKAEKIAKNPTEKAKSIIAKASWFNYYGFRDTAHTLHKQVLNFAIEQNLNDLLPELYQLNGRANFRIDKELAIEYCKKAKELSNDELYKANCEACIQHALAIFYYDFGELTDDQGIAYKNSVNLYKNTKDTVTYIRHLARYIDIYRDQGSLDTVALYLEELGTILETHTDLRMEASWRTLRSIYYKLSDDFFNEEKEIKEALKISKKLKLNELTAHYYNRLFTNYRSTNNYPAAYLMLDSMKIYHNHRDLAHELYRNYYLYYKGVGDFEKSLFYHEAYLAKRDSIIRTDRSEFIIQWEAKYKTQKKEAIIESQYYQRNILIILIFSIGLVGFLIWRAYRVQRKNSQRLIKQNQTIEQQTKELRNLDNLKSRFFANVSHELRTPLTLMLTPIENALNTNELTNKVYTNLLLAERNGKRLNKMINEILDLTKLEAGKLALNPEVVVLYNFLRIITANFESLANRKNIRFKFSYEEKKTLQVELDKNKTETILVNLLSNAFKFTPTDGTIILKLESDGKFLNIEVSDTGQGIHPEDIPNVFNRFYQTKNKKATAQGGTGIGLSLSREFVKLMNGDISVKSKLGQGTTFQVQIPKTEILGQISTSEAKEIRKDIELEEELDYQSISIVPSKTHTSTILLVEDNDDLRSFIQSLLSPYYHVITAENGKEALEKLVITESSLLREIPNLIISDIMMPIMDGYELLRELKSNENYRHIPVMMLTARAAKDDRLKALRIGVDDYMLKPFDREELMARVANLVANAKNRQSIPVAKVEEIDRISIIAEEETNINISAEDLKWLEELEELVLERLGNFDFSVNDLAQALLTNRWQLNTRIKALTGLTSQKYIQEIRLNQARTLLENGTIKTVKAVTLAVGIKSVKYFSKQFKERFGKSPSTYL